MNNETLQGQWPGDAPEWANSAIVSWFASSEGLHIQNLQTLIERPKPAKQKIDWSKSRIELMRNPADFPSPWFAWTATRIPVAIRCQMA